MMLQAVGIAVIALAHGFIGFAAGSVLLGFGIAMVYPTLLAAVADVAHPAWRASVVGMCQLWRDLGSACGALVAVLTFGSGVVVALRVSETRHCPKTPAPILARKETMA